MMPSESDGLFQLLHQHLSWYPLMEPRDVYKLLYQGVMGSEHLIASEEDFRQYLRSELNSVQANPEERLLEPVRSDETLLRLNLRPYKSHQLDQNQLVPLLIETAGMFKGSKNDLRQTWGMFTRLCQEKQIINFDPPVLQTFTQHLEQLDLTAMHHSEKYLRAYQPAYRLIAARFIPGLGMSDAG